MSRYRPPGPKRSKYITPEGAKKLQDELDYLWKDERPKVTRAVGDAAEEGDRSENAEYIYGKRRLRQIDSRIRFLSKRLDVLTIVNPGEHGTTERVYFGAWVHLEGEDGEEFVYRIVGPDEFDPATNQISMDSPMGKALMGKFKGVEVIVKRPKGDAVFDIVDISYDSPEDPG
ncbi:MAG TPA: transcription elongation factor GreB [Myxococcales bacterium]|nr:transcription elongation factor GreB [Myxococcales bacterium]